MTDVEVAAAAYVWGYPLVAMHRTRARTAGDGMVRRTRLATAADRAVVAPNDDTLYASGWFDLAQGDLVVDVGDTGGRYWSVMLLDAYTHVGYVSRRTHGPGPVTVTITHDPDARPDDGPARAVGVATRTVWVLARVVVAGPDDVEAATAVLERISVTQPRGSPPPPASLAAGATRGERFYGDLRAALALDPPAPWHPPRPAGTTQVIASAAPTVLDRAAAEGERRIAARGAGADRFRDGWGTRSRGADFDDDVAYRAAFAKVSLAGHRPAENRSYSRGHDGSASAVLRFPPGGEPPVDGFWSLTVYGPDLFLVPNELGRHSLGDRTVPRAPDGGIEVLLAPERPAGDDAAWLPTPPGPCVLVLRAYEGHPAVVDATWFPPDLEPIGTGRG